MKKFFNIVLSAALLMGLASCTDLLDAELREQEQQIPEDATVEVCFGTPSEIMTKADMATVPTIESMHVFVFNKVGVLIEAKQARAFGKVTANGVAGAKHWVADLKMGAAERHIHLVANLPKNSGGTYDLPVSGTEAAVMQSLITSAPEAAYWQCIVLPTGIDAYTYDGSGTYTYVNPTDGSWHTINVPGTVSGDTYYYYDGDKKITVNKGDYINTNGQKILDGKGLYASIDVMNAVKLVPMVRNFACIQVKSSTNWMTINQVALVNTPNAGYIAAFDDAANKFCEPYLQAGTTTLTTTAVEASGYPATVPNAGINTDQPTSFVRPQGGVASMFMYERGLPSEDPTCILVQGTRNGSTRWYKIEITNEKGSYFPIYRDFTYVVDIKSISDTNGYGSAAAAYAASPVGDISSSIETETLEQITDGKGLTLRVEYIDYTDMEGLTTTHTTTLLYKCYYTPTTGTASILTNYVDLSIKPYANTDPAVTNVSKASYSGNGPDGAGGWYIATITLDKVGTNMKKSDVLVEVDLSETENPGGYAKKMSRKVTYRVLPKQPITVTATPLASDALGQPTTVKIQLPANMGYSVFPLTLMIEASNNCLTPTETLTVETGKSLADGITNTFYFLRTISYSEYQNSSTLVLDSHFKTTLASGNVPATIYVKDKNNRFGLAQTTLN